MARIDGDDVLLQAGWHVSEGSRRVGSHTYRAGRMSNIALATEERS